MDTTNFQFHAGGVTEQGAKMKLAEGFARHLVAYCPKDAEPFEFWATVAEQHGGIPDSKKRPTVVQLHDHYGIRTIDLESADAFCDGDKV